MYKFFAFLGRMKYINRWSLMRSTMTENIMEHSQFVAVIAHCLATISNTYFGGKFDANFIAVKALFHETSEVITGDLPTPIKYFNRDINTAYKDLERLANERLIALLPLEMQESYSKILSDDDSPEKKIVKYADKICAYIKCLEELKSSNREFEQAGKTIKKDIEEFHSPEVDFFMNNFVAAFELSLDQLNA